jgi:ribosomal protein L37AE/L43A
MGSNTLNMSENKYTCKSCGSQDVYYDEKYGEYVCRKCGYVHRIEEEFYEVLEEEDELLEEDWFDYYEPDVDEILMGEVE